MKISVRIKKVEVLPARTGFGSDQLEIVGDARWTNDLVSFRVDDSEQARRTYVIGRDLDIAITPVRQ